MNLHVITDHATDSLHLPFTLHGQNATFLLLTSCPLNFHFLNRQTTQTCSVSFRVNHFIGGFQSILFISHCFLCALHYHHLWSMLSTAYLLPPFPSNPLKTRQRQKTGAKSIVCLYIIISGTTIKGRIKTQTPITDYTLLLQSITAHPSLPKLILLTQSSTGNTSLKLTSKFPCHWIRFCFPGRKLTDCQLATVVNGCYEMV